jgi:hypothetical protein
LGIQVSLAVGDEPLSVGGTRGHHAVVVLFSDTARRGCFVLSNFDADMFCFK